MKLASLMAERSTCSRLKVGAVITSIDYSYVYGLGYNGNAKGLPNCCDGKEPSKCGCLHSEINALLKVNEKPDVSKILFCTHMPCIMCAKAIINKGGFKKVFYKEPYRLTEGVELLQYKGIEVVQL